MEERKLVGRIIPCRNHQLFEFNTETCLLRLVSEKEWERDIISMGRSFKLVRNIEAKQNCVYISALNLKNAIKKVSKYYGVKVQF